MFTIRTEQNRTLLQLRPLPNGPRGSCNIIQYNDKMGFTRELLVVVTDQLKSRIFLELI